MEDAPTPSRGAVTPLAPQAQRILGAAIASFSGRKLGPPQVCGSRGRGPSRVYSACRSASKRGRAWVPAALRHPQARSGAPGGLGASTPPAEHMRGGQHAREAVLERPHTCTIPLLMHAADACRCGAITWGHGQAGARRCVRWRAHRDAAAMHALRLPCALPHQPLLGVHCHTHTASARTAHIHTKAHAQVHVHMHACT